MITLRDIIEALPSLSRSDLEALQAHVKGAMQFARSTTTTVMGVVNMVDLAADARPDDMLEIIADYCKGQQLDFRSPAMLKKSADYKLFKEKVPALIAYLDRVSIKRQDQRVLWTLALKQLHNEPKPPFVNMNCTYCMRNVHRLPVMIDRAFPGYAKAGILGVVLKVLTAPDNTGRMR